jgi:RND family efflux transporter MFP subunit
VYDLTILVASPQARDSIFVPGLQVYATAADAPREEGGEDDGIAFLKEQQWKTDGFRSAFAVADQMPGSVTATGEIGAAAGRFATISAPIGGVTDAEGVARSPLPGQRVVRGQTLARLTPSLDESGSAIAQTRAALREAEDEYARAQRLLAVEAIAARRVHEAEIRVQAAREALVSVGGGALEDGRVAVRAPIAGVVVDRLLATGARVPAGAPLFTIVDASVVWLTVHVPANVASRVSASAAAEFTVEGSTRRFQAARTVSVGSVIDSATRTVPVIYEVRNTDGALKVGAIARVELRTGERVRGVSIPATAVLDEDGRAVVYVQRDGERFEKRPVTVSTIASGRALISAGLRAGERVVSGAAYQIRLASLSTAVPTHGHEH